MLRKGDCMKFNLFFWRKNPKFDNDVCTCEDIQDKLIEEVAELIEAWFLFTNKPTFENGLHFLEEFWDVIQVLILMLHRGKKVYENDGKDFKTLLGISYNYHNEKIKERGWTISASPHVKMEINFDKKTKDNKFPE